MPFPWPDPFGPLSDAIAALFVAFVAAALTGSGSAFPDWTDRMPPPATNRTLSPVELAELVTLYGFPDRVTAVAVILGESGGNPSATNRQTNNVDRGLWQISSRWHPDVTDAQAYDVQASTQAALRISSGGRDFNPWHATKATAFAGHLRTAQNAVAEYDAERSGTGVGSGGGGRSRGSTAPPPWWQRVPIVPGVIDSGDVLDAGGAAVGAVTDGVGGALGAIASSLSSVASLATRALGVLVSADFWRRVAFVLAGLALLAVGVAAVFGRDAVSTYVGARTGGAVSSPA